MRFYPPKTTTIIREANTLESGELVYDIDTQKLYIGDGTTLGGFEVGIGMTWKIITGNTDAEVETGYHVDTNVNSIITLPLNPSIGNEVAIKLINSGGATITVDRNSNKINGFESNFSITKLYKTYRFIFSSLEKGWICEEADYINVLTDGANIPIDASISDTFEITLGGNRILDNPTNTYEGQEITIYIIQDGTGSRTLSYGTNYKFPGGTLPTLSTIGGSIDKLECRVRNGNLLCDFTSNYS